MNLPGYDTLCQHADTKLSGAIYPPRKLALLHTGAAAALSLLLAVVNFLLQQSIDQTGGLSGMATRSILQTLQTTLQFASVLILPFWEISFIRAAILTGRGEPAVPKTLLSGFHRFGAVLRLYLMQALIYIGITIVATQLATMIFMLTPLSNPVVALMESMPLDSEGMLTWDIQALSALLPKLIPVYILIVVFLIALSIPIFYRLRLSQYAIMDDTEIGAIAAMRISRRLMHGKCLALLRLDLRLWWYYALQLGAVVLCYGDTLLSLLGVSLPLSPGAAYFLFYMLYLVCQLALAWFFKSRVAAIYTQVYLSARTQEQ